MYNTAQKTKKTSIGGQAIIEGIVMKGPENTCTVVRKGDGELVVRDQHVVPLTKRNKFCGLPLIRGGVVFVTSLLEGMEAIEYSSQFVDYEEEESSKFELWLEKHVGGEKLTKIITGIGMVLGFIIPLVLFFFLPTFLTSYLPENSPELARNLIEGAVRICLFLFMMWAMSHMNDIKRTFQYHGAEHKTIFCYEAGLDLTVENVRKQERFHPRCGTSFLFVVIIISIITSSIVFSLLPPLGAVMRFIVHLIMLPLIVGISYEINRFAGRVDNTLTSILKWPGLRVQRLTVFEPDDSMIEVAIKAMENVIPKDESDAW